MAMRFSVKKMKTYIPVAIVGVMFLVGMFVVQYTLLQAFQKESGDRLVNRAFAQAELVETRMQGHSDALDLLGHTTSTDGTGGRVDVDRLISTNPQLQDFSQVGIVTVQGGQIYGKPLPAQHEQILMETFRGNRNVQFMESAGQDSDDMFLLFSVPLWRDDKVAGAVYGVLDREGMDRLFTSNVAKNNTILCLSSDFKHIILAGRQSQENEGTVADITAPPYEEQLSHLFQRLYYHGYGVIRIEAGRDYYMSATALTSMDDWYITSVIPADQVDGPMKRIFLGMSLVYVLLAAMCLLAVYTVERNEQKNREQIRRIAFIDKVTGLANWTKLQDEYLNKPLQPSQAFVLMDIDEFNMVNSVMGRDFGDAFLARMAGQLSAVLQPGESVCHMRADRFALCLGRHEGLQERLEQLIGQIRQSVKHILSPYPWACAS